MTGDRNARSVLADMPTIGPVFVSKLGRLARTVVSDFCGYAAGGRWQPLIDDITVALARAHLESAEEMRERAADQAHLVWGDGRIAASIRALPLTPEGDEE